MRKNKLSHESQEGDFYPAVFRRLNKRSEGVIRIQITPPDHTSLLLRVS